MTRSILRRPQAGLALVATAALAAAVAIPSGSAQALALTKSSARLAAPPTGKVGYTYDALGRLSTVTDPLGASATYAYDAVGNLTGITRAAAGLAAQKAKSAKTDTTLRAAEDEPAPTIDEVSENGTGAKHQVVITGAHLPTDAASARVKVGGLFATVVSATSTRVAVEVPPGLVTSGAAVAVVTEGGSAQATLPGRAPAPEPAAPTYTPMQAAEGVTALAGAVRAPDGTPLRGVKLAIEQHETTTGRDGRFLLTGLDPGHAELKIDGTKAKEGDFGSYEHGVDLHEGKTVALPWVTWLTEIDNAHAVAIPTKVKKDMVVTTPAIPGLEVHVPTGTRIADEDGKRVRKLSITKLDLEHLPFPGAPGMPLGWTIQPGLAEVSDNGLAVVYPNITNQPPGTTIDYVNQDADRPGNGWAVYGHGQVTPDGKQIVPDERTRLHELYQLGVSYNPLCQYLGLFCPRPGGGPADGDPVDLQTGLFVMSHTDLAMPDVAPIGLTRSYRQNDNVVRTFGLSQSDDFNVFVTPDGLGRYLVQMPDGSSVPFAPGADGMYTAIDTPTDFQGATMTGAMYRDFTVTFRDGRVWTFGTHSAMLISKTDRDGNTVTYDRDWSTGRVNRVTSPNGKWIALTWGTCATTALCVVKATDNIGRVVKYTYDPSGRLTTVTNPAAKATVYAWNTCTDALTCTQMASIKDPNNVVYLRNTFDVNGRVSKQTQADNSTFAFEYTLSENGLVTTTTVTNPRGAKRRVEFNDQGYSTSDTRAFGTALEEITTITRAAPSNRVTAVVDPLNRKTTNTYDARGLLLSTTVAAGTTSAATQSFTYEPKYGRMASVTNALGKKTTMAYDDEANTVTTSDPLAHTSKTELIAGQPTRSTDALGNVTTISYLDGDPVAVTDPLERTSTSYFDAAGRLLKATSALGRRTTFQYDVMNQMIKAIDPIGQASSTSFDANGNALTHTDALGRITKNAYDVMNRPISHTDALNKVETFSYDGAGALVARTDRNAVKTTFGYDLLDRPTSTGFKAVTVGTTTTYQSTITNTYDLADRLTKVVDSLGGTFTNTYDVRDRLTTEAAPSGSISYTYDAADRRTGMTVPGQVATTYAYDAANRLTTLTRGGLSVGIVYDAADRRQSVTMTGGLKQTYSYDAASQLNSLTYAAGTTSQGNLTYQYDAVGRPTTVGGSLARTSLPAVWSGATYNANNQLTALGTKTFTYDANGQLLNDGASTYTWNARNELTGITGATTAAFTYDPQGRRTSKKIGAVTTSFLYDGGNIVQERNGATITADLLTGASLDETFARTQGGVTSARMTDRLGSTVAMTNATGTPVTSYTYEPYGKSTTTGAASTNPLQFTGRENDGTGLQFNRARYYSPTLQRFISEDPLGASGSGDNLYEYGTSSPTVYTDPTGQFAQFLIGCAVGGLTSIAIGWGVSALTGQKYTLGDGVRDAAVGCVTGLAFGFLGKLAEGAESGAMAAAKGCMNSFTGDTPVTMADGTREPIRDVKLGDEVLAGDPLTGKTHAKPVTALIRHGGAHVLVRLKMSDGSRLDATDRHPFWDVTDGQWVDAVDLEPGHEVRLADGGKLSIESADTTSADLTAYNLTVADTHTYYAGTSGVLVHNSGSCDLAGRRAWELTREGASAVKNGGPFKTPFFKSASDGTWWTKDVAGHGQSAFKVYEETSKGLKWIANANKYGTYMTNQWKSEVGKFIPWSMLGG